MSFDLAARRASLSPRTPAVQFRGRWQSFAEMDRRATRLAARLATLGIGRGDRVGILATNHIAHFDLVLAAPKLGFIPAPFNFRLAAAEQAELGRALSPKLMLHDAERAELAAATGGPGRDLDSYADWLETGPAEPPPPPALDGEDVAMILLTGGSTGRPKGAMIPYRQLHWNAIQTCTAWGVGEADCAIQATPAFHAAFNVFSTPLFHAGGRVVLPEAFDPGAYLRCVFEARATVLFLVPTMFQGLAEHPDFDTADLSSVRWAISGGAPCPEPVRERFAARGIRFKQGYGMTEAGVNCFAISLDEAEGRPDSVGRPMPHTEAVIRGPDGAPVAAGETGELTLRGPHLSLGYFGRPGDTAESYRDGWLWTGDLAREDSDGYFRIVGRRKEMYISGGENVYPTEVEAALYAQPEVAECAVLGVPHARWGETGLAAIALKPGQAISPAVLRERLKARLAAYKVPGHFWILDTLPKSGAGKILKPELRRRFESESRT